MRWLLLLLHVVSGWRVHPIVHEALYLLLLLVESVDIPLDLGEGVGHPVRLCKKVWAQRDTAGVWYLLVLLGVTPSPGVHVKAGAPQVQSRVSGALPGVGPEVRAAP